MCTLPPWAVILLAVLSTVCGDLTVVVKTFERPGCLERLLLSINQHLPTVAIVVVNDGHDSQKAKDLAAAKGLLKLAGGVDYVAAEYDIGVGAGRNLGLSKVKSEYVLMMDDDFVVTSETDVGQLVKAVSTGKADIAGGELYVIPQDVNMGILNEALGKEKRRVTVSAAFSLGIDKQRKMLVSKVTKTKPTECSATDMISNFFVARAAEMRSLKWDDDLKLNEAEDFFLRAGTQGLKVQYCPAVKAMHDGQCTLGPGHDHEAYKLKRERGLHFQQKFFEKHDIQQYSSGFGGLYMLTCAFTDSCMVAHMWKQDELRTCDANGECDTHKITLKKHPETQHMRMFKCDASGKKCDQAVMT